MLRQKTFGGKSGVWYGGHKRKRGLCSDSRVVMDKLLLNESILTATARENSKSAVLSFVQIDHSREIDKQQKIQWDEVLCRPIYHVESSLNDKVFEIESPWKASNTESLLEPHDETQSSSHLGVPIIIPTPSKESEEKDTNVVTIDRDFITRINTKKVSCNRSTFGSKSHCHTGLDSIDEEKFYEYNLTASKHSLAFSVKAKQSSSIDDRKNVIQTTKFDVTSKYSKEQKSTKNKHNKGKNCKEAEQMNTVIVSVKQPNPNSDLIGARAYFQYLDKNEQFSIDEKTLDDNNNSEMTNSLNGQTRNRRKLTDEYHAVLKNEYNKYSSVCKDSNIVPIPLNQFVDERVSFTTSIYDGFLDE
jgi:hypothetical protein